MFHSDYSDQDSLLVRNVCSYQHFHRDSRKSITFLINIAYLTGWEHSIGSALFNEKWAGYHLHHRNASHPLKLWMEERHSYDNDNDDGSHRDRYAEHRNEQPDDRWHDHDAEHGSGARCTMMMEKCKDGMKVTCV